MNMLLGSGAPLAALVLPWINSLSSSTCTAHVLEYVHHLRLGIPGDLLLVCEYAMISNSPICHMRVNDSMSTWLSNMKHVL